jgi:protein gp37
MSTTSIEWSEVTWNPSTGCTAPKESAKLGCLNCYARILSKRLQAMGQTKYQNGFSVTLHEGTLNDPFKWKKPKLVFVNSMSDLLHPKIPIEFIQKVFKTMNDTPQHTYQVLTKRSERLKEIHSELTWTPNIWMGVSVEHQDLLYRIDHLREVPAAVRFLSLEPLLGPLPNLDLSNIHWAIVGGESGHKARPMQPEWVDEIHEQCIKSGVPFFFKQWGGRNKKVAGRTLHGKTYDEMPSTERNS